MKSVALCATAALLSFHAIGCMKTEDPTSEDVANQSAVSVAKTFGGDDAQALAGLIAKAGYSLRPSGPAGGSDSSVASTRKVECSSNFLSGLYCGFANGRSLRGDDALALMDFISRAGIRPTEIAIPGGEYTSMSEAKNISCRVDFFTRLSCTVEGEGGRVIPQPAVDPGPPPDLDVDSSPVSFHLAAGEKRTLSFYVFETMDISLITSGSTQVVMKLSDRSREISLVDRTEHGTPDLTNDIIKKRLAMGLYYVTVQTVSPRAGGDTNVRLVSGLVTTLVIDPNRADW